MPPLRARSLRQSHRLGSLGPRSLQIPLQPLHLVGLQLGVDGFDFFHSGFELFEFGFAVAAGRNVIEGVFGPKSASAVSAVRRWAWQ